MSNRTFGPDDGTGRTWDAYLADEEAARKVRLKASRMVHNPVNEFVDDVPESFADVTITTPATLMETGLPRTITTWRNRLLANGWEVKVGFAESHWPDQFYQNGNLKKAEHMEQAWWVNAAKPGRYLEIYYNYEDGKGVSGRTSRRVRGILKRLTDAEMQDVIEAEDE